jgi:hypothetical protein
MDPKLLDVPNELKVTNRKKSSVVLSKNAQEARYASNFPSSIQSQKSSML